MKFNTNQEKNSNLKTYNGEKAVNGDLCFTWINMLFTTNLNNTYYEAGEEQLSRFLALTLKMISKYGVDFAAKAVHYSRNVLGRRSASMLAAACLDQFKFDNKRHFYSTLFHRPDDVAECFAAIDLINGKRSHALVRGAADYISSLGDYQMGKYKMNGKKYNMYDIINITHAKSEVVNRFKRDTLKVPNTWETRLSSGEDKEDVFTDLIMNNQLGYLALIRNLRNILRSCFGNKQPMELLLTIYHQLIDEKKIKNSLVYPYQIFEAWKMVEIEFDTNNQNYRHLHLEEDMWTDDENLKRWIRAGLAEAFETACGNMPKFAGNTLFIIDVSGSMDEKISNHSSVSLREVGACYAEALIKAQQNNVDVIVFGSEAKKVVFSNDPFADSFDRINWMVNTDVGYTTNISRAFDLITKPYNRIILVSDMQVNEMNPTYYGWGYSTPRGIKIPPCIDNYYDKFGECPIYCFDLSNYNRQPGFCADSIYQISALNNEVAKMLSETERCGSFKSLIDNYQY